MNDARFKRGAAYFESIKKTKKEGHFGTKPWALRDQALGIDRPSDGHPLPVGWAYSAQTLGDFWALFVGGIAIMHDAS